MTLRARNLTRVELREPPPEVVHDRPGEPQVVLFATRGPVGFPSGTTLTFALEQPRGARERLSRLVRELEAAVAEGRSS